MEGYIKLSHADFDDKKYENEFEIVDAEDEEKEQQYVVYEKRKYYKDFSTDKFTKLASGGFGNVYSDKKQTYKFSSAITLESMININIPNVIKIKSSQIYQKEIMYVYDYKSTDLYNTNIITPKNIEQLIFAIINLNSLNMVHMDIKPGNILFHNNDLYISDLGGLHLLTGKDYVKNHISTYFCVSPENILCKKFSIRSQTWSIGIALLIWADNYQSPELTNYMNTDFKKVTTSDFYMDFINNILPNIKLYRIPVNTTESTFRDFINDCLIFDENKRPHPKDLLSHLLLDYKRDHLSPYELKELPITSSPITNFYPQKYILRRIYKYNESSKISYFKFCVILHLAFTTRISLKTIFAIAYDLQHYSYVDIIDLSKKVRAELKDWTILPGNSLYYSMKDEEHLEFFLDTLQKNPSIYKTLSPISNYYKPFSIELKKYIQ
jgi:serine/threonine protein kinase